ncbi:MAG: ABC transporter ATP-binding protein/permease [Thiohalomonadales bacterium]
MSVRFQYTDAPQSNRSDINNFNKLIPYLWEFRGRVLLALLALVLAKAANVGIPLMLKDIVDDLNVSTDALVVAPMGLLLAYGALRLASGFFNELRDVLFGKVRYRAMRRLTIRTLAHLHELSLRYHLERKTGAISADLQRGSASLSSLLNYFTFNIIPVSLEFLFVAAILLTQYDISFTIIIFSCVAVYVVFTLKIMSWRMQYRLEMNRLDSKATNEAIDSLINYETVKYFNNESLETIRCDKTLAEWEANAIHSQTSMSALNFGQSAIIAVGVTLIMIFAAQEVAAGSMTIGDLVLVNAFLLQIFIPLGFLGIVYRQIHYALADMDHLIKLLEEPPEIVDRPSAALLQVGAAAIRFDHVSFSYVKERRILQDISIELAAGKKTAVVGPSGAGKTTLARLLFRFYDIQSGAITIDGQDISAVTQKSLREVIGIVPQDTVLFNESIYYNLSYANPSASKQQVVEAAKRAHIDEFINSLPEKYDTIVGERGLKLSGGEKQRVAIARVLLKAPKILIFDEATSALDSRNEQAILSSLNELSTNFTTLVIAHRLSTIVDADEIIVLDHGCVVEQGKHEQLIIKNGVYKQMWELQQKEKLPQEDE